MCIEFISCQIHDTDYALIEPPRIKLGLGLGQSTADFRVPLPSNGKPPRRGAQIIIRYLRPPFDLKLFGGLVKSVKPSYLPYRSYSVSCEDHGSFLTGKSFSYENLHPNPIEVHLPAILLAGGGTRPSPIDPDAPAGAWPRDRLAYTILKPPSPSLIDAALNKLLADGEYQPVSFQNLNLAQACDLLAAKFGYSWRLGIEPYKDLNFLQPVRAMARVIFRRHDYPQRKLFTVRLDGGGSCEDKAQWSDPELNLEATSYTRVVVAKDAESLKVAAGVLPRIISRQIAIEDPDQQRIFPLLGKTNFVKRFQLIS